ncbi:DUF2304 domain-containing protein [archaeon]|jgi:hypothetical protein|nr:DUF2304 domain-containing protein [archaeon]MBT6697606.1 DUF2304 domain-containing protein [archaeon]
MAGIFELQLIGAGFSIFMFYICFTHYKRKEFALGDLVLWGVLWLILLILVLFPQRFDTLFGSLHVQGALQFIILMSLGVLYLISFFSYIRSKRNELKIQRLVTEISLREHKTVSDHKKSEESESEKRKKETSEESTSYER